MANVRCPMCSKLNTPDAEVCSYCGARLKPVKPSSGAPAAGVPGSDAPRQGSGSRDDAPDWLRSLRSDSPESGADEPSESDAEAGDVPDWLSRIRGRAPGEAQEEPGESAQDDASDDAPDWLKGLQGGMPSGESDAEPSAESPAGGDWFGRLQDTTTQPAEEPPAEAASDTPDWLRGLADETFPETKTGFGADSPAGLPSETGQAGGEEDWEKMLSSWAPGAGEPAQDDVQPGPAGKEEEDFSWLGGLEPAAGKSSPAEMPGEEDSFGLTGFLSELDQMPSGETARPEEVDSFPEWGQEAASTADELPDWFGAQAPAESQPSSPVSAGEGGLPEWLQGMGAEPPVPHAPSAAPEPEEAETGMPAWLSASEAAEPPRAEESAAGGLPSWLEGDESQGSGSQESGLPGWLSETEPEVPAAQPPSVGDEDSGIPAWMRADIEPRAEPQAEAEPSAEGLPDWFSSFGQAAAADELGSESQAEETPFGERMPFADQPIAEQPAGEQSPYFSFSQDPRAAEPASDDMPGEGVPDWLRDFEAEPPAGAAVPPLIDAVPAVPMPALEGDQPFAVDLPDWLAEDEAANGELAEQPVEMSGETLAQADLPDWVKEMRPIESIIPGETQGAEHTRNAEKSGPLAGLPGILPAEELAGRYSRPPVYSVKLRTSEKQRTQASQFETLLAQETQPLLIPPQGRRVQGLLVRILIALILLVTLAVPPLMGMEPLAIPALGPDETRRMFEEIDASIAPDEAILLAVDYEPALSGEMRLASLPVVEHLLEKNARIVVVSTRSSGPALAEQLLNSASANQPQFNRQQNFINLGFLPGDMISLLAFARQPAFAAPATLGGELAWENPNLQEISGIQDFTRVIVLTDSAETGRIWVEQVKPLMGNVPLLMVTSAQAAPMMAPFVQSGQVNGMVAGMVGGFLYAQWANQVNTPAAGYLASYQVGLLLAFALTLFGGLFSGGRALLKRKDKDEE